jgi:hypothetical protein
MYMVYNLQQLQVSRHAVNHTLGAQDSQHGLAATCDLSAPSILDNARAKPKANSLSLHDQQLLLRLDLQCDLGLATALPSLEDRRVGRVFKEVFVASEGSVAALGGDFA